METTDRFVVGEEFECELPPRVRREFKGRFFSREPRKKERSWVLIGALGVFGLAATLGYLAHSPQEADKPAPATIQAPPILEWKGAPRAQLVKSLAPRAQLVALPVWQVGEARQLQMPYGLKILGRLRGFVLDQSQLPAGASIGDTYLVAGVPWVWLTVPGTSAPTWVDP
jgi:hypothetical protein